ncbi:MAG TPA: four helix bundle protein [Pyrinomonadaceae bacterium]|nr:four helix bundle protein [Pyrinomonadaceae bacterium]
MKRRTQLFGLRIIRLVAALPKSIEGRAIGNQLVRAGTSVGANYRAACRARSKAEFIARLGIVEEEADESAFWIEIIIRSRLLKPRLVESLLREANELVAIMTSSRKTSSKHNVDQTRAKQNSRAGRNQKSKIKDRKSC